VEASIARFATRNRPDDRSAGHAAPSRREPADAPEGRSQEELWAARIAEQPGLISDIVNFIATARTRLVESPPVAPGDDPKHDPKSDLEPGSRERARRK
jgi:hypothetical protein